MGCWRLGTSRRRLLIGGGVPGAGGRRRERPPSHGRFHAIQAAAANFWQGLLYSM